MDAASLSWSSSSYASTDGGSCHVHAVAGPAGAYFRHDI